MNRVEGVSRRDILKAGAAIGVGAGIMGGLRWRSIEDEKAANKYLIEYTRVHAELPPPELTPEISTFADEMKTIFPDDTLTLELIRNGKFDKNSQTFELDRYHIVFNAEESVEETQNTQDRLRELYQFVLTTNYAAGVNDMIGIAEQARRLQQDPGWSFDRPLIIPQRQPGSMVGVALRGRLNDRQDTPSLMMMIGTKHTLETRSTARDVDGLHFSTDPQSSYYRAPFVFDASVRMEDRPQFPQ